MKKITTVLGIMGFFSTAYMNAAYTAEIQADLTQPPPCLNDDGSTLAQNDNQVISWETTTRNQFLARAHVVGQIENIYANETGHAHFSIGLGNGHSTLEVIYNLSFGELPRLTPGMNVEACGDYITSNAAAGGYQASPDGAIIHWIHKSDNEKHKSGYLSINGVTYGLLNGHGN